MGMTKDIGQRVEIVNIDDFHEITIALYQQHIGNGPVYLVHSYSSIEGVADRIEFVAQTMSILGGMDLVENEAKKLHLSCGFEHLSAAKLLFLKSCQVDPYMVPDVLPLTVFDKKSDQDISAISLGSGVYELMACGKDEKQVKRLKIIRKLMLKHGGLEMIDEPTHRVGFSCRHSHDILVGLLLAHAIKVRVSALAG